MKRLFYFLYSQGLIFTALLLPISSVSFVQLVEIRYPSVQKIVILLGKMSMQEKIEQLSEGLNRKTV